MKVAPSIVLSALVASAIFGLFSQELLMSKDIGFNLAVIAALLLAAVSILRWKKVIEANAPLTYLAIPIGVAIYGFSVPDSRGLDALNIWMAFLSIGYFCLRSAVSRPLTLIESLAKAPGVAFGTVFAGCTMPWLADWPRLKVTKKLGIGRGALVGCIAAIPFLVVFGNVLAEADPMFARLFSPQIDVAPDVFVARCFVFAISSAFLSGIFIYLSKGMFQQVNIMMSFQPDPRKPYPYPIGPSVYPTNLPPFSPKEQNEKEYVATFVTFFGLIALMFLAFVLIQVRYLFGGDAVVLQTEHLTYADYARRGFIEIVGVTAVCLPLIIFGQYALRKFDAKVRKTVNAVVVIVVGLLFLLLASAAFRLKLYVGAYGLSPLRVYVGAGMLWLLVLFTTYLVYGLKWKLDKIGKVVFASMVAITLGLNFAKPDYWIARVNLTRRESQHIDPNMLLEAGADARAAIEQYGQGKMTPDDPKKSLLAAFTEQQKSRSRDWRDLTLSQIMSPRD